MRLDQGEVNRQKGIKIGYLPQDGLSFTGRTVFEECLSVFDEAIALEQEQEDLAHRMGELDPSSDEYADVLERYSWVIDRLVMFLNVTASPLIRPLPGALRSPSSVTSPYPAPSVNSRRVHPRT